MSAAEQLALRSRLLEHDRIIAVVVDCPTQLAEIVLIWDVIDYPGAGGNLGMVQVIVFNKARLVSIPVFSFLFSTKLSRKFLLLCRLMTGCKRNG